MTNKGGGGGGRGLFKRVKLLEEHSCTYCKLGITSFFPFQYLTYDPREGLWLVEIENILPGVYV